ncbi:hypothetical protein PROFUN_03235 [Planoprotostelium fungivorum]|uniref:Protein BTG1-like n=1 Tax=Planoprotostelium fungivorum TaxID=1890364 RepID=A0A2P6NX29_9EUKA|nr:protein BTG1-like [Planoprotostelium fungivorum]PRP88518.1 hypothetical protein PROFUN_03235 [Planoprotostelium fungivorum]
MPEATRECEVASCWWTSQLDTGVAPPLTEDQLSKFQMALQSILEQRYDNHWYPIDPERGTAYRSISSEGRSMDQVITQAARLSGIPNITGRLKVQCIMWVDPSSVKVAFSHAKKPNIIWQRNEEGVEQLTWRHTGNSAHINQRLVNSNLTRESLLEVQEIVS